MDSLSSDGCGPPAIWGLCGGLTPLPRKKDQVTKPKPRKKRSDPKNDDQWHELKDFRIASWKVRSLYRLGAIYQVNKELYRYNIGIVALQEVRWPGRGECNVDNQSVLFYSGGEEGEHKYGTGFMVAKKFMGSVLRFDAISDRISILRVKGKFSNISILNAYALTELAEDEFKDSFYEHLEAVYDQLPNYDIKIVLGDFNAKIGREEIFVPTIGRHSKHDQSNDNGLRLISFATAKSMVIKSTMFLHKDIYKGTWRSPDGHTVNQIDHVAIDDRHKNTIQDVRSYRGADCDSDHYMIGIKLKCKIKSNKITTKVHTPLLNIDNLKDKRHREKFHIELSNRFKDLMIEDIETGWDRIKNTVKEVATTVIGTKKRKRRKKWWNQQCEKVVEQRRKYKILANQEDRWQTKYDELRIEAKRQIKRAKRQHLNDIVHDMERLIKAGETRKFYQEIREVRRGYQPDTQMLEDDHGNLVTDKDVVKCMWRDYF
ncbi:craniofacial development protein 2-like [Melitaea cinxia]|uniref:craniofacial development protein 2-like n=1 Tax=Melitaea cinxia TaxID=113334 RepID=UPI001E273B91|nr:craniofacial development protein 2-like [Melitaea cinxia]